MAQTWVERTVAIEIKLKFSTFYLEQENSAQMG